MEDLTNLTEKELYTIVQNIEDELNRRGQLGRDHLTNILSTSILSIKAELSVVKEKKETTPYGKRRLQVQIDNLESELSSLEIELENIQYTFPHVSLGQPSD